jgi:phosphoribosylformylglycinamidine synthase
MGEACKKFDTPVTGGNVSFYNQNPEGPVYPTPTIGMVGLVDDPGNKMTLDFKNEGDQIFLIGSRKNDINSSIYLSKIHEVEFSPAPHFDLNEEYQLQQTITGLIKSGLIESAHDISEGGLITTLLEKGFNREFGFEITSITKSDEDVTTVRKDVFLFGEGQSRVIVTVKDENVANFLRHLEKNKIIHAQIGRVTSGAIEVDGENWGEIDEWKELYNTAIEKHLAKELESEGALGMI